jgi:hypothetical protein
MTLCKVFRPVSLAKQMWHNTYQNDLEDSFMGSLKVWVVGQKSFGFQYPCSCFWYVHVAPNLGKTFLKPQRFLELEPWDAERKYTATRSKARFLGHNCTEIIILSWIYLAMAMFLQNSSFETNMLPLKFNLKVRFSECWTNHIFTVPLYGIGTQNLFNGTQIKCVFDEYMADIPITCRGYPVVYIKQHQYWRWNCDLPSSANLIASTWYS